MKPNFHVARVGYGRGAITIITRRAVAWAELPELRGAIEEGAADDFAAFLQSESGIAWLETLPTSTRYRLRKAAGIAEEYDGSSRVTRWRKGKGAADETP